MNIDEARALADEACASLRSVSYRDLAAKASSGAIETAEVYGASGTRYQLEIQFIFDNVDNSVRVWANINDGGYRAFHPVTRSFIVSPSGEFLDE